jgi:hypothetical protein
MTESPSTSSGGSLPSFVPMAFLYIERSCARIMLKYNLHLLSIHIFQHQGHGEDTGTVRYLLDKHGSITPAKISSAQLNSESEHHGNPKNARAMVYVGGRTSR